MDSAVFDGGADGKARGVVQTYPGIWSGTIVDVGCRSRDVEKALQGRSGFTYIGVDIEPNAEVVADLGEKLPFDDDFADVVTALDVLEHTDDIHRAFGELCRVASKYVVITLPNAYELGVRLRHLRGRPISGKYGLPVERPEDRHRWFFSLKDSQVFLRAQARRHGWRVADERATVGRRRARGGPAVRRWPNLLSQTHLVLLEKV